MIVIVIVTAADRGIFASVGIRRLRWVKVLIVTSEQAARQE
jgi:hypothetical protein